MRNPLFALAATVLALAGPAGAKTVSITQFGAIANDAKDDSAALQAAFDAIKASGGTILVADGRYILQHQVNFSVAGAASVSVALRGEPGSSLEVQLQNQNESAIGVGNLNALTIEDMTFLGKEGDQNNGGWILSQNYVQHCRIVNSQFLGLQMTGGIVDTQKAAVLIESCLFDGNAMGNAAIWAHDFRALTVRNSQFIDYANYQGRYLSKTPANTGSWIKVENGLAFNAVGQRRVVIEDTSFDEGAIRTAVFSNVAFVFIRGTATNLNSTTPGAGFVFDNVGLASVEQASFGYTKARRPAIRALNKSRVLVNGIGLSEGVKHFERDQASVIEQANSPAEITVMK